MIDQNKSEEIDWSVCTWKGSRRLQHQEFRALPFARKLEIIEEMNEFSEQLRNGEPEKVNQEPRN